MMGFFLFLIQGTLQSLSADAHFKVIAVPLNGGSVRHRHPCPSLLSIVLTSLETKVYREKRVRKHYLF